VVRIGSRNDGAKTAPAKVPAAARREKALELRAKGRSIRSIAKELKVSKSQVQRDLEAELKAAAEDRRKIAELLIDLELTKLDELEQEAWKHIRDGELPAIDRVLRSMERRAKLLGLDKTGEGGDTGSLDDLVATIERMREARRGD
jgi:outer membrane PBP1 activator LpoA protein